MSRWARCACAAAVALGVFAGCKDDVTRKLEGVADRACACRDRACADRAQADLDAALAAMTEPPASNATRIAALITKAQACIDAAR